MADANVRHSVAVTSWLVAAAIVSAAVGAGGCGEDPRIVRRAGALDVSGPWGERRDDGVAGASVVIATEADRNDVVVTITDRVVAGAEAAALARVVDGARRADLATTLVLGAGRDAVREETDGGENVSFDLGATTTIQVTSALEAVAPALSTSRAASMGWALRLDGDGERLEGQLDVFVRETQARPGDVDGFGLVTTGVASIPLQLAPSEP